MAWLLRVGWTRLERKMTSNSRTGLIQIEVPVNPKCPNDSGENHWPDDEAWDGVSQPKPQLIPV